MKREKAVERLEQLEELLREWIPRQGSAGAAISTLSFASSMLGFGFAALNEEEKARARILQAQEQMYARSQNEDRAQKWMLHAFAYRAERQLEAPDSKEIGLSPELIVSHRELSRRENYTVSRARQVFVTLEPWRCIDPYRQWGRSTAPELEWGWSQDCQSREEVHQRLVEVLEEPWSLDRARRFQEAFQLSTVLESEELDSSFARLREAGREDERLARQSLSYALKLASFSGREEDVRDIASQLEEHLGESSVPGIESEIPDLIAEARQLDYKSSRLPEVLAPVTLWGDRQRLFLMLAGACWFLNRRRQAEDIVERICPILDSSLLQGYYHERALTHDLVDALMHAPTALARTYQNRLLSHPGPREAYSTSQFFSLSKLRIVESLILSVIYQTTGKHDWRL